MRNDFAVFICTHGRPDKQYTLEALRASGYTGYVVLVLDDEDSTHDQYLNLVSTKDNTVVITFNKQDIINSVDYGTKLFRKVILYAKCACENYAEQMGLKYFAIADDDTKKFRFRYADGDKLRSVDIKQSFDDIVDSFIEYMEKSDLTAMSFGYTSSYLKGVSIFEPKALCDARVAYNFVFRNAKHKVDWRGSYGEDLITACTHSIVGQIWMNLPTIQNDMVVQCASAGGMTELYKQEDSFQLVQCETMYCPTCITQQFYKTRWYGAVQRENTFPKIISSKYRCK